MLRNGSARSDALSWRTTGHPECLAMMLNDITERYDAEERFERTLMSTLGEFRLARKYSR